MTVRAHTMFTTFDPTSNAVITAATVNIYNPGTVTPISATIFDKNGNPLSNPLTSDATTGLIDFYLTVAQEVDVVVSKAGFTTRTYSNVPVLDDSSLELTALLTTTGDTVYASSANTPARLPIGTNNYVMNVTAGVPKWTSALQVSDANTVIGVGTATSNAVGINVGSTLAGTAQIGVDTAALTFGSGATTVGYDYRAAVVTQAASFIMTTGVGYRVDPPTLGAASAITSLYGLKVANQGTSGVTNAYGVYVEAQSGAGATNIGMYNASSSQLIGPCSLGANTPPPASGVLIGGATPSGVAGTLALGITTDAAGGGATATLGTIGSTGPTTAAMNTWLRMRLGTATIWVPVWV